jgi:glycosyltransferase involved in cell wall biosynthesis
VAAFLERHGLDRAVRLLPFHDDLRPWWAAADAVVCPSESEALPAAVLEAMAQGLPALCTRVGDLPRLVEPGVTGWLCDPSDVASLAAGLEAVATTPPEQLALMGAAAARTVAAAHEWTAVLARTADLLRTVAGR